MKTGLVLEGGAMRGMYTAGALDVLLENDINFDGIIGTPRGRGVRRELSRQNLYRFQEVRQVRLPCTFHA